MKTELMRKDPLLLMEYTLERAPAAAHGAHGASQPAVSSGLRFLAGDRDFWALNPVWFSRSLTLSVPRHPECIFIFEYLLSETASDMQNLGGERRKKGKCVKPLTHIFIYLSESAIPI